MPNITIMCPVYTIYIPMKILNMTNGETPVDQGDEKEDDGVAKQLLPEQFPQGALPPAPVESLSAACSLDFPKQANMCCC